MNGYQVMKIKKKNRKKVILMAVGSSGGHIYPALAVAEQLEADSNKFFDSSFDSLEIHFVYSGSSLGKKIFSYVKYPVHTISIGGLAKGQSFWTKVKTLLQIPKAFVLSFFLIRKIKAQVVFGTGGAVTGPVLMTAFLMGKKLALWEGNALIGLANQYLSLFVSKVFTPFSDVLGLDKKKQTVCAYPLRKKSLSSKQKESFDFLDSKNHFKVLILGGSQGSFFLNQVVSEVVQEEEWREGIFIYHQTGEKSYSLIKEKYKSLKNVSAFSFSLNIEEYYKKVDLVFSRAGSGSIWEVASHKKALVLIPLTHSAGGHQLENAIALRSKNCVEMIEEKDFNSETFKQKLVELKNNIQRREQLAFSLKEACLEDGAGQIAHWILS